MEHIEGEKSSCWALKAQTCDCCLYLEEQKGIDVVKGRRQSRLKYSVDSCSGGDSAHCGGPACDVSGEGSVGRERQPAMRLPFCILEEMEIIWTDNIPGHVCMLYTHKMQEECGLNTIFIYLHIHHIYHHITTKKSLTLEF